MLNNSSNASGNTLRPRARIMRTIGDELISNEIVAIIELVKNAYDADATDVLIKYIHSVEKGDVLEIIDNGHGMTLDTILTTWMEPATSYKRQKHFSEKFGRRVLGEKGIGRFAAARIANYLNVITRRTNIEEEVYVFLDWTQFDNDEKYLDEVLVLWEPSEPKQISRTGYIQLLKQYSENISSDNLEHGTILRMEQLRWTANRERFVELRKQMARLVSPFIESIDVKPDFRIYLDLPGEFEDLSGLVQSSANLRNPHYSIRGFVFEDGTYELIFKHDIRFFKETTKNDGLTGESNFEGKFTLKGDRQPECGAFYIELGVWDRDSLENIALMQQVKARDIRSDLDNAAGISIYRDGFRVLPYGDPQNDWLRLDLRRVQNPTMRLSNNQIVGYISITANHNRNLRDQSNREGLFDNQALVDLRTLVLEVLSEIEKRRYKLRRDKKRQAKSTERGLFGAFDLSDVISQVKEKYPKDNEITGMLESKLKEQEKSVQVVQQILASYSLRATLGQMVDTILHDGRTPLAAVKNELNLAFLTVEEELELKELVKEVYSHFESIQQSNDVLINLFNMIEPFGTRKAGKPRKVFLEDIIRDTFQIEHANFERLGIKLDIPATRKYEVTVDQSEIYQVIYNLLSNSIYWLATIETRQREILVQINRVEGEGLEILFADSGPGVDPEIAEAVFDLYFTTKPEGKGLGLNIAGNIVREYYQGELMLLDSGPLSGANFLIVLRKRV